MIENGITFKTKNELRILSAALCTAQDDADDGSNIYDDISDSDTIRGMKARVDAELTERGKSGLEQAFAAARESEETTIPEPVHIIASMLDYPSVYMGGPSRASRRKAERIWQTLQDEGYGNKP
jgi:hypothetical protein